jgi:hypothetical protein
MPNLRISSSTGDAVALDREDRQPHPERTHEQRAVGAERQDVAIGVERALIGADAGDAGAIGLEPFDIRVKAEFRPVLAAPGSELFGELEAVAAFLVLEVDAAGERIDLRLERRHQVQTALTVEDAEFETE